MIRKLAVFALILFIVAGTLAALPGWVSLGCAQKISCTTSWEYGTWSGSPFGAPVTICKCKGSTSEDPCLAGLEVDGGVIVDFYCLQNGDCVPDLDMECMSISDSTDFMPSPGNFYPLCDCYDVPSPAL